MIERNLRALDGEDGFDEHGGLLLCKRIIPKACVLSNLRSCVGLVGVRAVTWRGLGAVQEDDVSLCDTVGNFCSNPGLTPLPSATALFPMRSLGCAFPCKSVMEPKIHYTWQHRSIQPPWCRRWISAGTYQT